MPIRVPILCRFWQEDDVWNGVAEHLPVAVFGATLDQAFVNLRAALEAHLEAVISAGLLEETFRELQLWASQHPSVLLDEISPSSPIVKLLASVQAPDQLVIQ